MKTRTNLRWTGASLLVGGMLLGPVGLATAQKEDRTLRGPSVTERGTPGVQERYVAGATDRMMGYERPIPLQVYLGAVRALNGADAPSALRLTDRQTDLIFAEMRTFGEDLRAFGRAHREEIAGIVADMPRNQRGRALGELGGLDRLAQAIERMDQSGSLDFEMQRGRVTDRVTDRATDSSSDRASDRSTDRSSSRSSDDGSDRDIDRATDRATDGSSSRRRERAGDRERPQPDRARRDGRPQVDRPDSDAESRREGFRLSIRDGERQQGDDRPGAMTDEAMSARDRLMELRAEAPSVQALQTRVWELLDESQRDHVGARLAAYQQEQRSIQEERRMRADIERRRAAREQASQDAPVTDRRVLDLDPAMIDRILAVLESGEIPERLWNRLPQTMRQRLESLPEGERAGALRRALEGRKPPDSP